MIPNRFDAFLLRSVIFVEIMMLSGLIAVAQSPIPVATADEWHHRRLRPQS